MVVHTQDGFEKIWEDDEESDGSKNVSSGAKEADSSNFVTSF